MRRVIAQRRHRPLQVAPAGVLAAEPDQHPRRHPFVVQGLELARQPLVLRKLRPGPDAGQEECGQGRASPLAGGLIECRGPAVRIRRRVPIDGLEVASAKLAHRRQQHRICARSASASAASSATPARSRWPRSRCPREARACSRARTSNRSPAPAALARAMVRRGARRKPQATVHGPVVRGQTFHGTINFFWRCIFAGVSCNLALSRTGHGERETK